MTKIILDLPFLPKLDANGQKLLELLIQAHQVAASSNANMSKEVAKAAYQGSYNVTQALISGMATTGGAHAPIREAHQSLLGNIDPDEVRIPGLGNSFYKGEIDPAFFDVLDWMSLNYPREFKQLAVLDKYLTDPTKARINAAAITAAVCEALTINVDYGIVLFFLARIPVWTAEFK